MRSASAIQIDLDAARAARLAVLTRGQTEGHDGASVGRASLKDISGEITRLEQELSYARRCGGITMTPTIGVAS